MSHGKKLLSIKDGDKQYKEAMRIIKDSLPVNNNKKSVKKPRVQEKEDIFLEDMRSQVERSLGTKVNFKKRGKVGKIEIEYYGEEDLSRILDLILARELD